MQVFVGRHRGEEISRIGQAIAANRPQVRQSQRRTVVFGDITTSLRVEQFNAELKAAWQYGNL
ncbi:hypothetical protein D3C78_1862760 [compost metagenome]